MRSSLLTRRNLLLFAAAGAVSFGLGWGLRRVKRPPGERIDWQRAFERKSPGGSARVVSLVGEAQLAGRPLALGDPVASGQRVRVGPDSVMLVSMPDTTLMELRAHSEAELHFDEHSGGVYRLIAGAVLAVVPEGNLYLAVGPAGTVGVRGSVFYREVFADPAATVVTAEGPRPLPEGAGDYFCACRGVADFLGDAQRGEVVRHVGAAHHKPFFLAREGSLRLQQAPVLNHFDDEIARLIDLMPAPKPDASWLDPEGHARPRG